MMADTPPVGRKVAGWGMGIGLGGVGIHAGMTFFQRELVEFLPEQHRLAYVLVSQALDALPYAMEGIGMLLYIIGAKQTVKPKQP